MEKENKEKGKYVVIILLLIIIILLLRLLILAVTGKLCIINNDANINDANIASEVVNDDVTDTSTTGSNIIVNNTSIDNYLGKWLLADQDYSYVNIKKNDDNSGYKIDILVNKEADYKDLELHCADNSGACYFSGDSTHNYSIMMTNDTIMVLPDYSNVGYWIFNK